MRALVIGSLLLALGLAVNPVTAHEIKAGSVVIEHPWARATTAAQKNGAVYMIIRNGGAEPDSLLGAHSGEAESASLHGTTITGEGVAQMRSADAVEIPWGGEVRLAPGGVHVMLAGLKIPLFEGVSFPLTLVFERAGEVAIEVEVQGAGAPTEHRGDTGPGVAAGGAEHGAGQGGTAKGDHGARHGN